MTEPPRRTQSKLGYDQASAKMQEQRDPQALVRQQLEGMQTYLQQKQAQLERWITTGIDSRALVRFAMLDMSAMTYAGEKLRECSRESIFMSLLACAVSGLEPGALKGEAFLVPFAKKAQYMAGWKGYVKQARRSREVVALAPQVVFDADTFDLDLGSGLPPVHKPMLRGPRGDIIGAYAVAKLVGSRESVVSYEVEWMDKTDLDGVRASAKKGERESDAWKLWEDQMYRKAPIRRIAKRLPMGHDYYVGIAVENAHEDGKGGREVLDILTDGEASRTEVSAENAASMRQQASGEIDPDEAAEIARMERESDGK